MSTFVVNTRIHKTYTQLLSGRLDSVHIIDLLCLPLWWIHVYMGSTTAQPEGCLMSRRKNQPTHTTIPQVIFQQSMSIYRCSRPNLCCARAQAAISQLAVNTLTPSLDLAPRVPIWYRYFGDRWSIANILPVRMHRNFYLQASVQNSAIIQRPRFNKRE